MRVLVFGDSITQGFRDEVAGGWCNRLVSEVMRRDSVSDSDYNREVFNLGISGDTTADLLKRIEFEIEARILKYKTSTYDVAVLAIGVNDTQYDMKTFLPKMDLEETKQNLNKIVAILRKHNVKVVFLGSAPVYEPRIQPMAWKQTHGYSNALIKERNNLVKELADLGGDLFIDLSGVYRNQEVDVLPDGIHPNAKGHEYIYETVLTALESQSIL